MTSPVAAHTVTIQIEHCSRPGSEDFSPVDMLSIFDFYSRNYDLDEVDELCILDERDLYNKDFSAKKVVTFLPHVKDDVYVVELREGNLAMDEVIKIQGLFPLLTCRQIAKGDWRLLSERDVVILSIGEAEARFPKPSRCKK